MPARKKNKAGARRRASAAGPTTGNPAPPDAIVNLDRALAAVARHLPNPMDESTDFFRSFMAPYPARASINAAIFHQALNVGSRYKVDLSSADNFFTNAGDADNWGEDARGFQLLEKVMRATLTDRIGGVRAGRRCLSRQDVALRPDGRRMAGRPALHDHRNLRWRAGRRSDRRTRIQDNMPPHAIRDACFTPSAVVASLVSTACGTPATPRRPNIVMVLVDDMRWDEMRVAGHPFIETPHMDRVAREGARFLNAFATTPLCSPSRASFLPASTPTPTASPTTRRAPATRSEHFRRSSNARVIARDSSASGTWATTTARVPASITGWRCPVRRGHRPVIERGWRAGTREGLHDRSPHRLRRALHRASLRSAVPGVPGTQGDSSECDSEGRREPRCRFPVNREGSWPPSATADAMPAARCRDVPARSNRRWEKPALLRPVGGTAATRTRDRDDRRGDQGRIEMLLGVDDSLGRILATLEKKGVLDDTVVVFTSDHGYFYGEHGLNEERRLAYEETIRIPLLIRYPRRVAANVTRSQMVLSIDLAPTLLELAGVQPGADFRDVR